MRSDELGGRPVSTVPGETPVFLALVGPTAVGKSSLSLEVAETLGAEIVSVDSRQVYRGMDVGTAKPDAADRARVVHHGLDRVDPDQAYSAGRFAREAREWIADIRARGRIPLLVGGTGFFLKALMEPLFREPEMDAGRLQSLRGWLGRQDRSELARWVAALDPARREVAAEGGPQRLTRTLEVPLLTGRSLTWWHREAPAEDPGLPGVVVVLERPRDELDRRIDARAARMVEDGFPHEVRVLLDRGFSSDDPGLSGVGYREMVEVVEGRMTREAAVEAMARATRQYARRQLTWFRNQLPEHGVVQVDATRPRRHVVAEIVESWTVRTTPGSPRKGGEG
jgi:tRNA dimethylallyltransferase